MPTRTDKVPNTSATAASAGTDLNGAAVVDACAQIRERLAPVAARLLDVRCCERSCFDDGVRVGRRAQSAVRGRLRERRTKQRVPLFAQGFYRTPGIHFDRDTGRGQPFHYFTFGAAVSEVEVDGFTGAYRLLRVDILQDVGDSISPIDRPRPDRGRLHPGRRLADHRGAAVGREGRLATARRLHLQAALVVRSAGRLRSGVPRSRDAQPDVVIGSKAVGEPPLMLAISVREALRDAVGAPSRPRGRAADVTFASPATPERVFFAIAARSARRVRRLDERPAELIRAPLFHTPADPFIDAGALVARRTAGC